MKIFVRTSKEAPPDDQIILEADANLSTGGNDFCEYFGTSDSIESDLLLVASAVFAADRLVPRGEREDFIRRVELSIPVINIALLQPLAAELSSLLRALSQDTWLIGFRYSPGNPVKLSAVKPEPKRILLFSGGLDSLAAAHKFGKEKKPLVLVSHVTHNRQVRNAQTDLASLLTKAGNSATHYQFFASSRNGPPAPQIQHDVENTQRTRSFLYMTLGALVARRISASEVLMVAENGQMAIHLPITQARISAFSTHTAHPDVLKRAERFFAKSLLPTIKINNPFVNLTKGEVVKQLCSEFAESIPISISCWKNTRIPKEYTHCGACIPCYLRRIAIETNIADVTAYARDPWNEPIAQLPADDDARRNFIDYAEFIRRVGEYSDAQLIDEWPELTFPEVDAKSAIKMYKRAAVESKAVFSKYPNLTQLLQ